jgi:hypothetical protein
MSTAEFIKLVHELAEQFPLGKYTSYLRHRHSRQPA